MLKFIVALISTCIGSGLFLPLFFIFSSPFIFNDNQHHIHIGGLFNLWATATLIALPHVVFLGLPLFFVLNHINKTQWWLAAIVGFFIGIVPISFMSLTGSNYQVISNIVGFIFVFGISGIFGALAGWATFNKLNEIKCPT